MNYKRVSTLIFSGFLLFYADHLKPDESDNSEGYTDIVSFRNQVIAVGTDGRIDHISKSGEKMTLESSSQENLNGVFSNHELLIAVGDHGTILYSQDGKSFQYTESNTDENINSVAAFNDLILASADSGLVLVSTDGKFWRPISTGARGNILSMSSNDSFFIGITDAGEIIKSVDGMNWEITDYNQEYAGYNPHANFKKILAVGNSIVILGTHDDGFPAIWISSLGNVWTERLPVYYDDEGVIRSLTHQLNDILYDPERNQFILACDDGVLFSLPNCAKCNKRLKISGSHLNALIHIDDCLMIAGAGYSIVVQKL